MRAEVRLCDQVFNDDRLGRCSYLRRLARTPPSCRAVERPEDIVVVEPRSSGAGTTCGRIDLTHRGDRPRPPVRELVARIDDEKVTEVIVATNPTVEGDTMALYLARL